jgi:hypothetical protein
MQTSDKEDKQPNTTVVILEEGPNFLIFTLGTV